MKRKNKMLALLVRKLGTRRPETLWHRYAVGFLFIFLTVSASHWASVATISAAEGDAKVISVSSGQRMLSQRILFLMSETDHDRDPHVDQRLEQALNLFETSHNWLVEGPDLSPALQYLYFESEPIALDAFSRRFVQLVGIASTAEGAQKEELTNIVARWGTEELLIGLKTAADLFRQDSEAHIARLQLIQKVTLLAALGVLLLEALLIFLPAQISVNQAFKRLEARRRHLKTSLKALKLRNAQLTEARQRLAHAADHDALTGLSNRRAIYEYLSGEAFGPKSYDATIGILKLDLDQFKEFNETAGHDVGDAALSHVAQILRDQTSGHDMVGRVGADEFVVLVTDDPSLQRLSDIAKRLITDITKPFLCHGSPRQIGASVGYTLAVSPLVTPDQILIEADLALFQAKQSGGGVSCVYSNDYAQAHEMQRQLMAELRQAISDAALEPYIQPQIHARTGALYGCEVLARWQHPERGILSPGIFMAAAEEAQLVDQIDLLMLEKGLDFLEQTLQMGIDLPGVSVNASPQTLRDVHFHDRVLDGVRARHLGPEHLVIEVLESTLIEGDTDVALLNIQKLLKDGFRVVLDDFGTGYASMSNLSRLALSGIKLDQSLIRPIPEPRTLSIAAAMISLSRSLKMSVVAEGVESHTQIDLLSDMGCDVVQGYAIGKPMPVDAFPMWYSALATGPMAFGAGGALTRA